jgi:lipoprotein-anchoring transpeptidase ErfK/SrfK
MSSVNPLAPAAPAAAPVAPAAAAPASITPAPAPAAGVVGTTNDAAADSVAEGTPLADGAVEATKSRTFKSFRNPAAAQERRDKIAKLLFVEVVEPFNLRVIGDEDSETKFVVATQNKHKITLIDGTRAKPSLDMLIEKHEGGAFVQVKADRESFEYSNAAGFARAVKTMLVRNAKLLGLKEPTA